MLPPIGTIAIVTKGGKIYIYFNIDSILNYKKKFKYYTMEMLVVVKFRKL